MDPLAPVRAFDRLQRRHAVLAVPVAVLRNFSDRGSGNYAALIAYWGFVSLFPLLLVFVTVLGFVLQGDPAAQRSIAHSAVKQFGGVVGDHPERLRGSGIGLAIGLAGALWSGLAVTVAAQNAFNNIYGVPHRERPDFFITRWRGLKLLAAIGTLQILSTAASALVAAGLGGSVLVPLAVLVVALLLNLALFYVAFRFLTAPSVSTRELLPGIALSAIGWEILQTLGTVYVRHVVKGASQVYGTFATVIGLLALLYLGARVVVYSAEVNVVLTRRLWPRSLFDPPERADREVQASLAEQQARDHRETVTVRFQPPDPQPRSED